MKVFVLGGNGSVGRAFAKIAAKEFGEVVLLDLKESETTEFRSISADCLNAVELGKLIQAEKPDIIVNSINMATIFSKVPAEGNRKSILFHLGLYDALSKLGKKISYLQVGTLGTGGLGFNVPFTHGEGQDDLPLFHKAALSGVTTSMLVLLSRSLKDCHISEIKPGLSIFNTEITVNDYSGCSLVLIDGGENGHYTYNELEILTAFMGLTTPERIAAEAVAVLKEDSSGSQPETHDVVRSVNSSVIEENEADRTVKEGLLKDMRSKQGKDNIIATGNLGPPSLTRDLILSAIFLEYGYQNDSEFREDLTEFESCNQTLAYIGSTDKELGKYLGNECNYENYQALQKLAGNRNFTHAWELVAFKLKSNAGDSPNIIAT